VGTIAAGLYTVRHRCSIDWKNVLW